ncbi:hypothetical protein PMIT1342_00142 [Prochlorococcus marinus str. MIT 1342]|nr:hypothetical protein PMIT1342_00142 [Prochlorococcus marinus str. MIT 1342]
MFMGRLASVKPIAVTVKITAQGLSGSGLWLLLLNSEVMWVINEQIVRSSRSAEQLLAYFLFNEVTSLILSIKSRMIIKVIL